MQAFFEHLFFRPFPQADTEPVQIQRREIDLSKIVKRVPFLAPCGSRMVKFLIHDWFVR